LAAADPLGCAVTDGAATADEVVTLGLEVVTLGLGVVALGLGLGLVWLGLGLGLEVVTLGLAVMLVMAPGVLALRLGAMLAIALLTVPPHPAAMHPAARIAAERRRILVSRRMSNPSAHSS